MFCTASPVIAPLVLLNRRCNWSRGEVVPIQTAPVGTVAVGISKTAELPTSVPLTYLARKFAVPGNTAARLGAAAVVRAVDVSDEVSRLMPSVDPVVGARRYAEAGNPPSVSVSDAF